MVEGFVRMKVIWLMSLCLLMPACASRGESVIRITPDSPLDTVLDALEQRGKDLKDFSADVTLTSVSERTGESSAQTGKVVYQDRGQGDSRIKVNFDKRKLESGATQNHKQDYLLQDGWLTDRDYQKKLEVRRQVLKPGQKMNMLKLGEGPFPLPIGQEKGEVKKQFDVTKLAPAADDPKDTVHVKLVPKKDSQFEKRFRQIDVYVDVKTNMPRRIETSEKPDTARSTELTNLKLNAGVKDDQFTLPNIDREQGWNRREEPFK
jgi:outer membrane lipoprotein-sorting protein